MERPRSNPRRLVNLVLIVAALVAGCSENRPFVWVRSLPPEDAPPSAGAEIQKGDELSVFVRGQDPGTTTAVVNEDGSIIVPPAGRVVVGGASPEEAARRVEAALKPMLVEPHAVVTISKSLPPKVTVVGEVARSGTFPFEPGDGVLEALAQAGGLTPFADRDGIYVVRVKPKALRVRFRYDDLAQGEARSIGFRLHDGDVVVVD